MKGSATTSTAPARCCARWSRRGGSDARPGAGSTTTEAERLARAIAGLRARGYFLQDLLAAALRLRPAARVILYPRTEREAGAFAAAARAELLAYRDASGTRVALIGREAARLRELKSLDLAKGRKAGRGDRDAMGRRIGELLGYPRCCVDAFDESRNDRSPLEVLARSGEGPFPASTNFLYNFQSRAYGRRGELARLWKAGYDAGDAFLISWVPCRYDCEASAAFGATMWEVLRAFDAAYAARVMRLLSATMVYHDDWRFEALSGGEKLPVRTLPIPRRREPSAVIRFREIDKIV